MFILTIIIQIHSHLACIPCTVSSAQCSLKYARAHNRRPQHTMSPKFNDIYVHSTHTKTSLYMFIHIVSNIYPSLTCVQHALSLLHLHASFNTHGYCVVFVQDIRPNTVLSALAVRSIADMDM